MLDVSVIAGVRAGIGDGVWVARSSAVSAVNTTDQLMFIVKPKIIP